MQLTRSAGIRTSIPLLSICPKCGHEQTQSYTHGALSRLLHRGHPVEGYCIGCDEFWAISAAERAGLAARVAGVPG